jgi:tRNA(Ile)-lysidine synthase
MTPGSSPSAPAPSASAQVLTLAPDDLAHHRDQGTEGAARLARYEALRAAAAAEGLAWIATGHTKDDQAETVVLQLLRGAGPDGLAGMATLGGPAGGPPTVWRPLLGTTRAQTRACCEAVGATWREDPTNADLSLLRNAVRARVLPLLEELRPGAVSTLARTAELARDDRAWAEDAAESALASLARGGAEVAVSADALAALPRGLGRRVVRAAAAHAGQAPPPAAATDGVLALTRTGVPDGTDVTWPGGQARRADDTLVWPPETAE